MQYDLKKLAEMDNESLANKLLGGAVVGGTGMGLGSGLMAALGNKANKIKGKDAIKAILLAVASGGLGGTLLGSLGSGAQSINEAALRGIGSVVGAEGDWEEPMAGAASILGGAGTIGGGIAGAASALGHGKSYKTTALATLLGAIGGGVTGGGLGLLTGGVSRASNKLDQFIGDKIANAGRELLDVNTDEYLAPYLAMNELDVAGVDYPHDISREGILELAKQTQL